MSLMMWFHKAIQFRYGTQLLKVGRGTTVTDLDCPTSVDALQSTKFGYC